MAARRPFARAGSTGGRDRPREDAKLAFPRAAGRQRQRPADEDRRSLVDSLVPGFRYRHRLDRRPAGAARPAPADLDFAADPLIDERERRDPGDPTSGAQRGRARDAVKPPRRIARGQREIQLHRPRAIEWRVPAPREAVAGAEPGAGHSNSYSLQDGQGHPLEHSRAENQLDLAVPLADLAWHGPLADRGPRHRPGRERIRGDTWTKEAVEERCPPEGVVVEQLREPFLLRSGGVVDGPGLAAGRRRALLDPPVIHLPASCEDAREVEVARPEGELGHRAARLRAKCYRQIGRPHPELGAAIAVHVAPLPGQRGRSERLVEPPLCGQERASRSAPEMRQIAPAEDTVPVRVVALAAPEI